MSNIIAIHRYQNRTDPFLALRGLACLMVVVFHCNPPRGAVVLNDSYDLTWLIFSYGFVDVWVFFALSGYLMGKAFFTKRYDLSFEGVMNFWRNRALRIFPLYYFSVFILVLFAYPHMLQIENWGHLFRILSYTYDHTSPVEFNEPIWSISAEVQFYIIVPFLCGLLKPYLTRRRLTFWFYIIAITIGFCSRSLIWFALSERIQRDAGYVLKYWYHPMVMNLDVFLCGFFVNSLVQAPSNFKKWHMGVRSIEFPAPTTKILAVILIVLLHFFSAYHFYYQKGGIPSLLTFFVLPAISAIVTAFFIFAFETDESEVNPKEKLSFDAILRNPVRLLELLGVLSYGIYVWHFPILTKTLPSFDSYLPFEAFLLRLLVTLSLSTALAILTYKTIEVPATRLKVQTEQCSRSNPIQ